VDPDNFCVETAHSRVGEALPCWVVPDTGHVAFEKPSKDSNLTEILLLVFASLTILCSCYCCGKASCDRLKYARDDFAGALLNEEEEAEEEYASYNA